MNQLRGHLYRAIAAGACLLSLSSGAEAAESIRVLLSADVLRLDIRSGHPLWAADAQWPWSGSALVDSGHSRWQGVFIERCP